ncbi:Coq4 family protein [Sphingomonas dokdonensis]|uniref:Coenzyme Q (Ubiquinone) biosynthesis protein Coq4 n=1 Tax=Sphingomonas dokdonensis TaxID=344880 RepID=A0A245ZTV8_9SPHN|nr:Coq4 family protein [Sphingomonas dokdonensis]OWK33177.1 coenzyme Q (ubiquinone) biosynthesis protein Coq4 [Sphingomonas dokdonensis]
MAAKLPPFPGSTGRRDWNTAFDAIKKLLNNGDDTVQVFRIMRALNVGSTEWGYAKLLGTEEGGRIAREQAELSERFSDRAWVDSFAPGTVGAAYRDFLDSTGYSADGLVAVSREGNDNVEVDHPYAWFGRRTRDIHDIWHVMTGYKADESLGEAALVAFSYAQVGGAGWAFIGSAAALKSLRITGSTLFARAVMEGYQRGKAAKWLAGEDYLKLMHEPLGAARKRLGLTEPVLYKRAQAELGDEMASYLSQRREEAVAEPERLAA